jgi:hypothetical protein
MEKINMIVKNLLSGTPQALVRFNDGEIIAMVDPNAYIARGAQKSSESLQRGLKEAIKYKAKNYFIGLPCSLCYPEYRYEAERYVDKDYPYKTHATVLTNSNFHYFRKILMLYQGDMVYVSGEDHNVEKLREAGYNISNHITVPSEDAWSSRNEVYKRHKDFDKGDVVLVCAGPLSRWLVYKWYKKRPDVTFLDIGSLLDPYTRGVFHRCHNNTLPYCMECNN